PGRAGAGGPPVPDAAAGGVPAPEQAGVRGGLRAAAAPVPRRPGPDLRRVRLVPDHPGGGGMTARLRPVTDARPPEAVPSGTGMTELDAYKAVVGELLETTRAAGQGDLEARVHHIPGTEAYDDLVGVRH